MPPTPAPLPASKHSPHERSTASKQQVECILATHLQHKFVKGPPFLSRLVSRPDYCSSSRSCRRKSGLTNSLACERPDVMRCSSWYINRRRLFCTHMNRNQRQLRCCVRQPSLGPQATTQIAALLATRQMQGCMTAGGCSALRAPASNILPRTGVPMRHRSERQSMGDLVFAVSGFVCNVLVSATAVV